MNIQKNNDIKLKAVCNDESLYEHADYVIIATPTNFNEMDKSFDMVLCQDLAQNKMRSSDN